MPSHPTPPSPDKFAWSAIAREGLPKRPAEERIADYDEIYGNFDEETVRAQARRCIQCPHPLCMQGCPLGNRIPEWLRLTEQGLFLEAAAVSRSTSNMPEICSRVCPQERLCEGACILNVRTQPVAIGAVERFINDCAFAHHAVALMPAPFSPGSDLAEIATDDWGVIQVDGNQMTSVPGIFAGGDSSRGPSLVVHAVRDGLKAAEGIMRYLHGREVLNQLSAAI